MDQPLDSSSQQPEWFENFIANYDTQNPKAGQILHATVIRRDQEGLFLDLGLKKEILIPPRDLEQIDADDLDKLIPGSLIPVMVTGEPTENHEIEVSLSKALEKELWDTVQNRMQAGDILSLEVVDHNRGGLIVRYESLRGFVPYSLIPELQGVRNPKRAEAIKKELVGKMVNVKITEVDPDKHRLILSAESAQNELRARKLDEYKRGQVVIGRVVKVVDFGAFVDLGGVDGLIHISQLAWKKVKHPSEVVKLGDEIEVKIIEIDRERHRIGLSRKTLMPGPWQTLPDELKAGDYVEGIITRLVNFGAFAKIPQGVEGLIHSSQIGYSAHQDPQNAVKPGDKVLLKVLEVKPDKKRIALSMRQVPMERQISWAFDNQDQLEDELTSNFNPDLQTSQEEPQLVEPVSTQIEISTEDHAESELPSQEPITEPPQPVNDLMIL